MRIDDECGFGDRRRRIVDLLADFLLNLIMFCILGMKKWPEGKERQKKDLE